MIKLIVSDMDGTLLDETGYVPEKFFRLYPRLKEKGIKFAVASGRQYATLVNNFSKLKDDIVYIAENGNLVKLEDKELFSSEIPKKDVKRIIDAAERLGDVEVILCGKSCAYAKPLQGEKKKLVEYYYNSLEYVQNLSTVDDDIIKIAILDVSGAEEHSFKTLHPLLKNTLQVKVSGEVWLDVFNNTSSKGEALKIIQQRLGITKNETMCFGDYYNDLELFKESYYSFAMENAPEDVKKHARFIAKSNLDHGVIKAINECIFKKSVEA